MHAKNSAVDKRAKREVVEDIGKVFPGVDVAVLSVDFVIEAVGARSLPGLVVSSKESNAVRVVDLEEEEEFHGFNGVVAAVDEISDEDVRLVGDFATDSEQLEHVEELAVHVSAHVHWRAHWLHV